MSQEAFSKLVGKIAFDISKMPLDSQMQVFLNKNYGVGTDDFKELKRLCAQGEVDGWLAKYEAGDIKYGRVIKPGHEANHFSVDVVRMKNVRGPHHIHTKGEIGAIMQISGSPVFDGLSEGWYVYESGSHHHPTIEGGEAYVLYFLPDGSIEFTGK